MVTSIRIPVVLAAATLFLFTLGQASAQTGKDLTRLRDEVASALKNAGHWSNDIPASLTLSVRSAFKEPERAGSFTLLFSKLPEGVSVSETWDAVLASDAKGALSIIPGSLKPNPGIAPEVKGLKLPSKHEVLLASYAVLRNPSSLIVALPFAQRIVAMHFIDAIRDPAKPAGNQTLAIFKNAAGKAEMAFNITIDLQLDFEHFMEAMDPQGGLFHYRTKSWFSVVFQKTAGKAWAIAAQPWEAQTSQASQSIVGKQGGRYRKEVLGLFANLERDGLDVIFGENKLYLQAITKAADFRMQ